MKPTRFKPVKKKSISVPDTLMAIPVGDTVFIDTKEIKTVSIRATASRLNAAKKASFEVTEKGLVNQTKIQRIS